MTSQRQKFRPLELACFASPLKQRTACKAGAWGWGGTGQPRCSQAPTTARTCTLPSEPRAVPGGPARRSRGLMAAAAACRCVPPPSRAAPLSAGAAHLRRTFQKGGSDHQSPGAAGTRGQSEPAVRVSSRPRRDRFARAGRGLWVCVCLGKVKLPASFWGKERCCQRTWSTSKD